MGHVAIAAQGGARCLTSPSTPKGTVFVFTRTDPPVVELTSAGKLVKTWGDGMFALPHGIRFDRRQSLDHGRARRERQGARWFTSSTLTVKVLPHARYEGRVW